MNETFFNKISTSQKSLYHYTDMNALIGILQNNELWLSERNYMNDVNDEKYIADYVRNYLISLGELDINSEGWNDCQFQRELLPKENQFIFSTSLEADSIHHWNFYSGNGAYCIEFDREKLDSFFKRFIDNEKDYFAGKVLYYNERIGRTVTSIAKKYIDLTLQYASTPVPNKNIDSQLRLYRKLYQHLYSLIKQQGHKCEAEYRFLTKKKGKISFRQKDGLLVPFIKAFLQKDENSPREKLPITKIIIGPYDKSEETKRSLKLFLKETGYSDVKIEQSSMNMREKK